MERSKPAQKEIRVLLAHSTRLMREGMAGLLKGAGFEMVADA